MTATKTSSLPSYIDQNFLLVDAEGSKFVLKIMNFEDSKKVTLLEVQTECMSFLRQQGVPTHKAIPNTEGQLLSFEEKGNREIIIISEVHLTLLQLVVFILFCFSTHTSSFLDFGQGAHKYCVRLLTYIPGKNVSDCPLTNEDLYHVGQLVGNVNKILQEVI